MVLVDFFEPDRVICCKPELFFVEVEGLSICGYLGDFFCF